VLNYRFKKSSKEKAGDAGVLSGKIDT